MDVTVALAIFLAVLLLVVFISIMGSREKPGRFFGRFDERQMKVRGKAFKAAFIVMTVYYLIYGMLITFCKTGFGAENIMIFFGLEIGFITFAVYCILRDAFLSLNQSFITSIITDAVCALIMFVSFFKDRADGLPVIVDGKLTETVFTLSIGITFSIVLIASLVRHHYEKKEDQSGQ